jgi:Endonuclease/Exonuclease/phosphatase family.
MKRFYYLLAALVMITGVAVAAPKKDKKPKETVENTTEQLKIWTIGFYNLENLFDTINDPTINDEEYLPNGGYQWNTMKYTRKLENMSYAISRMPENLAVLGVAEIENRTVLEDLVAQQSLANRGLKIVHEDSPDLRGVDVGLLYNPKYFKYLRHESHHIKTSIEGFRTRDQLVVTGLIDGEEVSIVVVHWPSRRGGKSTARMDAAATTHDIIDSLFKANNNVKVIMMGDLNDDPTDESLFQGVGAKASKDETKDHEMYNPCVSLFNKGVGSLGYNDQWNLFDQILVSGNMLIRDNKDVSQLKYYKSEIFNRDFLKVQTEKTKDIHFAHILLACGQMVIPTTSQV